MLDNHLDDTVAQWFSKCGPCTVHRSLKPFQGFHKIEAIFNMMLNYSKWCYLSFHSLSYICAVEFSLSYTTSRDIMALGADGTCVCTCVFLCFKNFSLLISNAININRYILTHINQSSLRFSVIFKSVKGFETKTLRTTIVAYYTQ